VVEILTEAHYFEQRFTSARFEPVAWPAHLVWVD
jgi:hypothetical protein